MHTFITVEKGRFGRTPDILTTVLYLNFSRTEYLMLIMPVAHFYVTFHMHSHAYEGIIL